MHARCKGALCFFSRHPMRGNMDYSSLQRIIDEQDAQDMVEYSLLLAFIALAAVGILSSTSGSLINLWNSISAVLANAAASAS